MMILFPNQRAPNEAWLTVQTIIIHTKYTKLYATHNIQVTKTCNDYKKGFAMKQGLHLGKNWNIMYRLNPYICLLLRIQLL